MCQIVKHLLTVFAQYDIREVIVFIYNKVCSPYIPDGG